MTDKTEHGLPSKVKDTNRNHDKSLDGKHNKDGLVTNTAENEQGTCKQKVNGQVDKKEVTSCSERKGKEERVFDRAFFRDLLNKENHEKDKFYYAVVTIFWVLSLGTRLYDIAQPPKICWDETHFGKFASYYINGTFFFDVHPPLGKMLLALSGWMSGYGGGFPFDKPGDLYGEEKYVGMRVFCALMGGFCVPLAYLIVFELTKCLPAAIIAGCLVLFDHGTLTLSRFILLDSILMFFMMISVFCLVKFQSWSDHPFSVDWWGWMFCTGYFLACTFSVKWVGLFVILLAGLVTIKQLWDLLGDLSLSMFVIGQHFVARVLGLIILPILTYMFFFGVHFQALPLSGPGDGFFSSTFQSTLKGSALHKAVLPKELAYGSIVTLKNTKAGGTLLHSHQHLYPKEHPPEQQQVTGYSHKDPNNEWIVKKPTNNQLDPTAPLEYVKNGDIIRLEHVMTKRNLHSHNEKAPITNNLMQVSCYGDQGNGDSNDDWSVVVTSNLGEDSKIQSVKTTFRLVHANTGCALGETEKTLPKWGWEQREMACYPTADKLGTQWSIEGHVNDRVPSTSMEFMAPSFLEKIYESHVVMAQTNSGFKPKEGEVTSQPWQWPINYRGQVFSGGEYRIYLLGNPIIWWGILAAFAIFFIIYTYHAVREQRGYQDDVAVKGKQFDSQCRTIQNLIANFLHWSNVVSRKLITVFS
ncbi:protein O-mannosyl-transferase 2-like isoform X2 [Rhopilema esculentum]|uniref:protein O-mannosyl-transferase 2-like isoform X2 n=1 Tax=Rhopilema esculentum TaxID=499914 RepID=UPI0031D489ED